MQVHSLDTDILGVSSRAMVMGNMGRMHAEKARCQHASDTF